MIRTKFLQVLLWFRDHFHFLFEVVARLSVGIEKKEVNQPKVTHQEEDESTREEEVL